jgi:hypothetical protein
MRIGLNSGVIGRLEMIDTCIPGHTSLVKRCQFLEGICLINDIKGGMRKRGTWFGHG